MKNEEKSYSSKTLKDLDFANSNRKILKFVVREDFNKTGFN